MVSLFSLIGLPLWLTGPAKLLMTILNTFTYVHAKKQPDPKTCQESKPDKTKRDVLCWITGYRHFVLVDSKQITGHRCSVNAQRADLRTDYWIPWTNLTVSYMDMTVVRSDWFHYCKENV